MDFIRINIYEKDGYLLKVGMPYVILGSQGLYFLRFVHENLRDQSLIPFINHGQVFVFP
jgi:hypothetical protein